MSSGPTAVDSTAPLPLPPIRHPAPLPLMAAVSEDPISLWLKLGALEKLEQAVLDGYGDHLYGKTSRIPQVNKFLRQVPLFQAKIREIHESVVEGRLPDVEHLIDRRKLAFCRDHLGASPLHKAVLYKHPEIVQHLLERYGSVVHARDHQGRTALHYAAVVEGEDGPIYQMLQEAGADARATDVYGKRPDYYLNTPGELTVEQLMEGAVVNRIKRIRPRNFKSTASRNGEQPQQRGFSAKPPAHLGYIRELIGKADVHGLDELVLQGNGSKMLGEISPDVPVKDFLDALPAYLEQISEIHTVSARGRLEEVKALLQQRNNLAMARDQLGAVPLHKAALYGQYAVAEYLARNYPASLNAKDMNGHTPLHYAAALKDSKDMYYMMLNCGASSLIPDIKGKTPDYYLNNSDQLSLDQVIKRSQMINATYIANTRIKSRSPMRKSFSEGESLKHINGDIELNGTQIDFEDATQKSEVSTLDIPRLGPPRRTRFRRRAPLPPPRLQRLEITSANIRKWLQEEDLEKIEGVVLQGYADKVSGMPSGQQSEDVRQYVEGAVPRLLERIQAIHSAVAKDDLTQLQSQLDKEDYALAKDPMGMTPVHRAVILGREEALKFLISKFPETVNARDKDGRTALHYAAAKTRRDGIISYKMLVEAGANTAVKDNRGRSPEYYKTHHLKVPVYMPAKLKTAMSKRSRSEPPTRRRQFSAPTVVQEKVTLALKTGDMMALQEVIQDGYGQLLLGRTSWYENVRIFLKSLPQLLSTIKTFHEAIASGDVATVQKLVGEDEKLLHLRNAQGLTAIHMAVDNNQPQVLQYFIKDFPMIINSKDNGGRTPLHMAGQNNNQELYKMLLENGANTRILDQRGRTAEFYMNMHNKVPKRRSSKKSVYAASETAASELSSEITLDEAVKEQQQETMSKKDVSQLQSADEKSENGLLEKDKNDELVIITTTEDEGQSDNQAQDATELVQKEVLIESMVDEEISNLESKDDTQTIEPALIDSVNEEREKIVILDEDTTQQVEQVLIEMMVGGEDSNLENKDESITIEPEPIVSTNEGEWIEGQDQDATELVQKDDKIPIESMVEVISILETKDQMPEGPSDNQDEGTEIVQENELLPTESIVEESGLLENIDEGMEQMLVDSTNEELGQSDTKDAENIPDVQHTESTVDEITELVQEIEQLPTESTIDEITEIVQEIEQLPTDSTIDEITEIVQEIEQLPTESIVNEESVLSESKDQGIEQMVIDSTHEELEQSESQDKTEIIEEDENAPAESLANEESSQSESKTEDIEQVPLESTNEELEQSVSQNEETENVQENVQPPAELTVDEESNQSENKAQDIEVLEAVIIPELESLLEAGSQLTDNLSDETATVQAEEDILLQSDNDAIQSILGENEPISEGEVVENVSENNENVETLENQEVLTMPPETELKEQMSDDNGIQSASKAEDIEMASPLIIPVSLAAVQLTENSNVELPTEGSETVIVQTEEAVLLPSEENPESPTVLKETETTIEPDTVNIESSEITPLTEDGAEVESELSYEPEQSLSIEPDTTNLECSENQPLTENGAEVETEIPLEPEQSLNEQMDSNSVPEEGRSTPITTETMADEESSPLENITQEGEVPEAPIVPESQIELEAGSQLTDDSNVKLTTEESEAVQAEELLPPDENTVNESGAMENDSAIDTTTVGAEENPEVSTVQPETKTITEPDATTGNLESSENLPFTENGAEVETEIPTDPEQSLSTNEQGETGEPDTTNLELSENLLENEAEVQSEIPLESEQPLPMNEQVANDSSQEERGNTPAGSETSTETILDKMEAAEIEAQINEIGDEQIPTEETGSDLADSAEFKASDAEQLVENEDTKELEAAIEVLEEMTQNEELTASEATAKEVDSDIEPKELTNEETDKNNNSKDGEEVKTKTVLQDEVREDSPKEYSNESQESSGSSQTDRLGELIDRWIEDKDLLRLEHVVIAGQGERLIGKTSDSKPVQEFLNLVPTYMERIRTVHEAVVRGNLNEVRAILNRKRFALSRDQLGASPLHLAVLHGHTDVILYIVNQFPETLDGPDNEGRTPLHYAALVRDGGEMYQMLKNVGANEAVVDKLNLTPQHYLEHPEEVTIGDLLQNYTKSLNERPSSVDVWQRPPTSEIMKRLTPASDTSPSPLSQTEEYGEKEALVEEEIMPLLTEQLGEDSQELMDQIGDAVYRGIIKIARYRPDDPIGYLATWFSQYAVNYNEDNRSTAKHRPGTPFPADEANGLHKELEDQRKAIGSRMEQVLERMQNGQNPTEDLDERKITSRLYDDYLPEEAEETDVPLEYEDRTKMKDEEGKTVLHFAAVRPQPPGSFYTLIGQTEVLLAERDAMYRTARDVAEENEMAENTAAIDQFVTDTLLQGRFPYLTMLVHEGYDQLQQLRDSVSESPDAVAFLQECDQFEKQREELHNLIRHGCLDAVVDMIKKDASLVTSKNTRGRCSLHIAILYGHIGIIDNLIQVNASAVHVPDNLGRTPLHYTMATEFVDLVGRMLIKAGAFRNSQDVKMRTPSFYFVYKQEIMGIYEEELALA